MSTPEAAAIDLAKTQDHVDSKTLESVFDRLKPVTPEFMLGEWKGGMINTDHSLNTWLASSKWAGKAFHAIDDVDPIVIFDDDGKRVWYEKFGKATLREVKIRGVVSAAMVYDILPIVDSFRWVTDDLVFGVMDTKLPEYHPAYFFYLERLK